MRKNTYWKDNGKYQSYADALINLIPDRGPVADVANNRKLDHCRKALNWYRRLHENRLVDRWDDFAIVFGGVHPGHHIYCGLFLESLYTLTEEKLDIIVLGAAEEQGLIGVIECVHRKPDNQ